MLRGIYKGLHNFNRGRSRNPKVNDMIKELRREANTNHFEFANDSLKRGLEFEFSKSNSQSYYIAIRIQYRHFVIRYDFNRLSYTWPSFIRYTNCDVGLLI